MIQLEGVWKVFAPEPARVIAQLRHNPAVSLAAGEVAAVRGVDLTVNRGELLCILGLSGCGKSTLLRMINRLISPSAGRVSIDSEDIATLSPAALRALRAKRIGMVFQSHALIEHMTIHENVALPQEILGISRQRREARAEELLTRLGLGGLGRHGISSLSGGMKQRVGLARALAADPDILLMDEPFSALDPLIRVELQDEFRGLSRDLGKTTVFITHDVAEALRIADRIAVMRLGQIEQIATPGELLAAPANEYVARFVGLGQSAFPVKQES